MLTVQYVAKICFAQDKHRVYVEEKGEVNKEG